MIRREPCVCGGVIVADEAVPGPAVLAHNRSPQHEAWRLGMRMERVRGVRFRSSVTVRLVDREAAA